MYCPKCGSQNIEDARFCRGCGSDIGLVSQALSGNLPEKRAIGYDAEGEPYDDDRRRIKRKKDSPRLDKAITSAFSGIGFLIVSLLVLRFAPGGRMWWFWMLIPAFTMLGGGVAEYVRYKQSREGETRLPPPKRERELTAPEARVTLPPRNTSELIRPPSVTEGTTRHLDLSSEAPTRNIGTPLKKPANDD